jgi:hypothetical protein
MVAMRQVAASARIVFISPGAPAENRHSRVSFGASSSTALSSPGCEWRPRTTALTGNWLRTVK